VDAILDIILVFFGVLVSATIIERLLEFLSIVLEYFEPYIKLDKLWWAISRYLQKKFAEALKKVESKGQKNVRKVIDAVKANIFKANTQVGEPVIIQVCSVRKVVITIMIQLIGIIIGISIAFKTNMDIFERVAQLGLNQFKVTHFWGELLTGILIGSGTSPVHSLIRYAESKKESQKRQAQIAQLKASLK